MTIHDLSRPAWPDGAEYIKQVSNVRPTSNFHSSTELRDKCWSVILISLSVIVILP